MDYPPFLTPQLFVHFHLDLFLDQYNVQFLLLDHPQGKWPLSDKFQELGWIYREVTLVQFFLSKKMVWLYPLVLILSLPEQFHLFLEIQEATLGQYHLEVLIYQVQRKHQSVVDMKSSACF